MKGEKVLEWGSRIIWIEAVVFFALTYILGFIAMAWVTEARFTYGDSIPIEVKARSDAMFSYAVVSYLTAVFDSIMFIIVDFNYGEIVRDSSQLLDEVVAQWAF